MPLLSIDEVKAKAQSKFGNELRTKSAGRIIKPALAAEQPTYDIFLSHSYKDVQLDSEALLGLHALLKERGYKVYVDWIDDADLSRESVTPATAKVLRS